MISLLSKCWSYFLFAGFFSLFINTLQLTFSLYMLGVYDGVLYSSSLPTLLILTLLACLALIVWGFLEFCRSRLLICAGIKLDKILSHRVLKSMLQDLCRIDSLHYKSGLKDIQTLRNYLGGSSIFAFFDFPWIFIYLSIIYIIHPVLGATATVGAIIIFTLGTIQDRMMKKRNADVQESKKISGEWIQNSLRTARELQTMGMTPNAYRIFCSINNCEIANQDRSNKILHIINSISTSFGIFMQVLIYGVGATLVLLHEATPGVIIAASIIMGQALGPVRRGITAWNQTISAKEAYNNLNTLLQGSKTHPQNNLLPTRGKINVNDVSLEIGQKAILHGINLSLQPGELMGIVGSNGSGKTSLCRLMLGMWHPTNGEVLADSINMYDLDSEKLGEFCGYLPQTVELFAGTVSENIARMGSVDPGKVLDASKNAGAHEMILHFSHGYDTDIGEAGFALSGGQRQRVGLARALYGDPQLVILDEPNSNLDETGEQALFEALTQLQRKGTTVIMITHKLSLLTKADKILLLENGKQILFSEREHVLNTLMERKACAQ